ncbi:phage baseplate assembly protein J [Campylobacter blaseri]|uniref:Baseplate assembly protein n=1 Tax=Campylobacter blaseri TaxID=2042961 RepID=A0A2P8QYP2_9BACT|nr:baseplate J/gp47 family protein [Campylobacter blaseri]PSM51363.1 baseplate assembly protein [Campylobacter blaseri]PSM52813.1 baseplate assembly protein [Campylobacter blaseri]QKF86114.1 phage baseplate assembly protein J [Campylobacter blaseri]
MVDLKSLPFPKVIEELKYDELLNNIKTLFIGYLNNEEIKLLESDRFSALLETLAYRELILRARINSSVKAMLLPYATGSDLDNVVAIYGINRLSGAKPTANFEFSLSQISNNDTIIPKGTILSDGDTLTATLNENVVISAGELKAQGLAKLNLESKESDIKTEYIQTPLPFLLKAKQLSPYSGGSDREDDERLRKRAILSLERFSTAGAKKAYIYQTLSATPKVLEASVRNGGAGIVQIYIKSLDMSELVVKEVKEYLSGEMVRPLTDNVEVYNATVKEVSINADVGLVSLDSMSEVDSSIKKALPSSLKIGEDLNISRIYKALHQNGVYRAKLKLPQGDITADESEFIKIINVDLNYKKASL